VHVYVCIFAYKKNVLANFQSVDFVSLNPHLLGLVFHKSQDLHDLLKTPHLYKQLLNNHSSCHMIIII